MLNVLSSAIIGVLVTMLSFHEVATACAEKGSFIAPFISIKCEIVKEGGK